MKESPPGGRLLDNIVLFGRVLRLLGLPVAPHAAHDLGTALAWINVTDRAEFKDAARTLFVIRKEDIPAFEAAFDRFWSGRPVVPEDVGSHREPRDSRAPGPGMEMLRPVVQGDGDAEWDPSQSAASALAYSPSEVLRKRDFSELTDSELEEVKRLLSGLTWSLGERRTRRWQRGNQLHVDFRRTFRSNMRNEGELLRLARRRHKWARRPLVALADVSGSMERYTEVLLHFLYGLTHGLSRPTEVFLFGTRLTRVTRSLERRDIDQALRGVSEQVPDWSGGTRIGKTLKRFNYDWSRRVLGRGAVVLLISDGWDSGDIGLLRREMARLQRSCHRLIWLNPLLGSPGYEPLTQGMSAALPYVDVFLPVHNLESLEGLANTLAALDDARPARRQSPSAEPADRSTGGA